MSPFWQAKETDTDCSHGLEFRSHQVSTLTHIHCVTQGFDLKTPTGLQCARDGKINPVHCWQIAENVRLQLNIIARASGSGSLPISSEKGWQRTSQDRSPLHLMVGCLCRSNSEFMDWLHLVCRARPKSWRPEYLNFQPKTSLDSRAPKSRHLARTRRRDWPYALVFRFTAKYKACASTVWSWYPPQIGEYAILHLPADHFISFCARS